MKYEVSIGERTATLDLENTTFRYTRKDGSSLAKAFSIEPAGQGCYSVLIEGRSYQAVLAGNGEIVVNGKTIAIDVSDPRKLRGRGSAERREGRQIIAAPMPGRVIRILVEAGQEAEAGQGLIVVEAMKMQNEMKSPRAGKILEIRTTAGAAVAAGDVLLVIE